MGSEREDSDGEVLWKNRVTMGSERRDSDGESAVEE